MKPKIGITMGDPASIGPELCIRALARSEVQEACIPIVIGDRPFLERAMQIPGMPKLPIREIASPDEAVSDPGIIQVIPMGLYSCDEIPYGVVSAKAGDAAFQYVHKVIEIAIGGLIDATVTNALNKEALNLAGHHFAGHTEIYAYFTDTKKYTMLLAYDNMKIVHVSTHVSLREACDRVKKERVLEVIRIANQACIELGIQHPRIGVAGLNPHCGEDGLFGTEELDEILPAIKQATQEGMDVSGPVPPDTVFCKARGGWYDIVVAMYHDQGHIPLKLLGFVYDPLKEKWQTVSGVNITLGLPIIRTSVDHGTAFDQAGKGTATEDSLVNAIEYAVKLAKYRETEK